MAITIKGVSYTAAYTHGGKFHADDVCSAALLLLLDPSIHITRGFSPPNNAYTLAFDIGNGPYDHHQEPREERENGRAYAAFGKLWRDLGEQFDLTPEQCSQFDRNICTPMDVADNTGRQNPLSELIGSLNPAWDEQSIQASNQAFFAAVNVVIPLLAAWINRAKASNRAEKIVNTLATGVKDGVVVSDMYVPTGKFPDNVDFFICPSTRGGWQGMSLRHSDGSQVLFPETWRGSQNLPKGMSFCHACGFLGTFDTQEIAVVLCSSLSIEARRKQAG